MFSFLLGSGFSVPADVPSVTDINAFLLGLEYEDIYIQSDNELILGAHPHLRYEEHHERFIVDFIQFYDGEYDFDYEELFDYCYAFLNDQENADEINTFYEVFWERHNFDPEFVIDECHAFLRRFAENLQQLVRSILSDERFYRDISCSDYPPYDNFFSFLNTISEEEECHIHTLNHDMLVDYVGNKLSNIFQKFSDGFEEMGSPFYGEVRRTDFPVRYNVRLRKFLNNFNTPISFYKLHGSIDTYVFRSQSIGGQRVKTKYGVGKYLVELYDQTNDNYVYEESLSNIIPDFLSGKTTKTVRYQDDYYATLFNHFRGNLEASRALFIIGYGFKDEVINQIITEHFNVEEHQVFIIDINRSEHIPDVINENCTFIGASVDEVNYEGRFLPLLHP